MDTAQPEVNATPLIDVLLVLLVMLILTVPIATHQTSLSLPVGGIVDVPREVRLVIEFDGRMFWDGSEIANHDELLGRLRWAAAAAEQPTVLVLPDKRARYEPVAQVLAAAQRMNVERISISGVRD